MPCQAGEAFGGDAAPVIPGRLERPAAAGGGGRLDARLLVAASGLLVLLVIASSRPWFPLLTAVVCLGLAVAGGIRLRTVVMRLANPLLVAALMVLFKAFSGVGWQFSALGLQEGALLASRVAGAATVLLLLGHLISVTEVIGALAWWRAPRTFIEIALLAWRYLFVLLDDAAVVYAAQRNRLGYSGMVRGLHSFGTLAGLLTVKAFDTSRAMTVAMTQRGYDGRMPLAVPARLSARQSLLFGLCAGLVLAAWYLQNHGV